MRIAGLLRPGTIGLNPPAAKGKTRLVYSEDDERPVVEDERTTVVDDKPPSVWQRLSLKQLRWGERKDQASPKVAMTSRHASPNARHSTGGTTR